MGQKKFEPDELQKWRRRMGFTQKQAATALGMSVRTYQGWELGRRRTHVDVIRLLMRKTKPRKPETDDPTLF